MKKTIAPVTVLALVALPILGVLLILVGFSDYNDDGPSGPLFGPLIVVGLGAFAATALAAGIVLGASIRGARD